MKGYRTLRQLDRAMKSTIRKKELIDRLRTVKNYYITPADQTILLSMLIDYEEKIEDILKDFKDRG
tara:strand:+ start:410 stop:607 length:198 start_codon:yes stop_codon:yes gene_type:complete